VAAAASTAVFALGHSYHGAKGVLVAALAGAFMTGIVALSGSLMPAMAIHAALDIVTAYVDWLAMQDIAPELASMRLGEAS
jgi:membrane protease YdiL (CAAX protease family)